MLIAFSFQRTAITVIRLLLAGLLLIVWAGLPRSGYSAPEATVRYVAPGGSDSTPCTAATKPCEHIQWAIDQSASGDTIQIAPGTYIEPLTIRDLNLTLTGQSAANTFLDGGQVYQILSIIRESTPSMTISLSGVTLQNGQSAQPGGAIAVDSNSYLSISNSNITNNTSSSGGGIFNNGFLKLINVTVSANSASQQGGGIYNVGYTELNGVLLNNNQALNGGGISNLNALTITASSFVSNISSGGDKGGGGIYNVASSSKLILLNSVLSGNKSLTNSGAAIFNSGILTGTGTTIVGNQAAQWGGGIYNDTSGQAFLTGVSVNGNTAGSREGGGIYNQGALIVTQSALVYNASSTSQGGGLNNAGTAWLTNVTISNNTALSGGGISNSSGTLSLQFSTVSENSSPGLSNAGGGVTVGESILAQSAGNACGGTITSAGYNVETGTSCKLNATQDFTSVLPSALQLGPLQDNGGGTLTRAIAFSSLARDSAGACPPPYTDQRGIARPQPPPQPPQSSICDRGAYEVVGYANANPLDIGVGQCLNSSITINDKFAVRRVLAGVNLLTYNSTRAGLTIRLLSPGLPRVTLLGPAAGTGKNLDTMFDDSASSFVPANGDQNPAAPYYDSVYKPSTPLLQVRGVGIKGTWALQVCNTGAATVTLNRWVLVVPEITDFKVYLPVMRR